MVQIAYKTVDKNGEEVVKHMNFMYKQYEESEHYVSFTTVEGDRTVETRIPYERIYYIDIGEDEKSEQTGTW